MDDCTACGTELDDDNHEHKCVCGEVFCDSCLEFHQDECVEYVAAANDKWAATTPARAW